MMPDITLMLARAHEGLEDARRVLAAGLARIAAREAYFAAFHAAQALVAQQSGRIPKTHRGLLSAFGRIAKEDPALGPELGRFLAEAYEFKEIADYALQRSVDAAAAEAAITRTQNMIERIEARLAQ